MKEFIVIELPDSQQIKVEKGTILIEVARKIATSLGKKAIAGKLNSQSLSLNDPLMESGKLEIISIDSHEGLFALRQTAARVFIHAIQRVFGDVKLGVGSQTENGFYYDFHSNHRISKEDFKVIEEEMKKIVTEDIPIELKLLSSKDASQLFESYNQSYKVEIINEYKQDMVSVYRQGQFVDLYEGPYLPSTGWLKAYKLLEVSGVYWRGEETNDVLQRVYGIAFRSNKELVEHLKSIEEAKKRDHRKLGKQLELFMFSDEAPGMPFYLPKGQIVRQELEDYSREVQRKSGYNEVRTPSLMNQKLWEESGHWEHYHENMYFSEVDKTNFALKPMNCPGHMLIFKDKLYSYRDLPVRVAEFGQVHRHEFSGALNGLLRVRTFCQDDAHIFISEDQMVEEIRNVFRLVDEVYQTFGFSYKVELSTRPEKSLGNDAFWENSEVALKQVLDNLNIDYVLNEGDGAFYGPKIDFHIEDALHRSHQCATIQLDYQMPEKFNLSYINENNEKVRPVVIHRAIFGSIDRFLGILIEHYAGAFPTWLAPTQVKILTVAQMHEEYATNLKQLLLSHNIRVEIDNRNEKLGYKIREAQLEKVPYVLIIGNQEVNEKRVNVRKYGEKASVNVEVVDFVSKVCDEITSRQY
ncbi:threonine--tRNA ligase [Oceanobacillus iheyensis]|uniref:threonine--tRNA ligase n=1 Tax=Oceanobacillus iheyensis TaxID=182710 RepID=UPI003640124E